MHQTGLIAERNCTWCVPGKYQTGVGLIVEVNCTLCIAGKYQTGSGCTDSKLILICWLANLEMKPYFSMLWRAVIQCIQAAKLKGWQWHLTGLITEDNCTLCAAGTYQTGSGPYRLLLNFPH